VAVEDVLRLRDQDRDVLLKLYRNARRPAATERLAGVLAVIGNEQVAAVFCEALTNRYAGKRLRDLDAGVLFSLPEKLGVLARKSDVAFEFLKQGVERSFWERYSLWRARTVPDTWRMGLLRGSCIRGLGLSGRPAVTELLDQLHERSTNSDFDRGDKVGRAFSGAAFHYDMILVKGEGWQVRFALRQIGDMERITNRRAWRESERGKKWAPMPIFR
jgi:hypothetical protein